MAQLLSQIRGDLLVGHGLEVLVVISLKLFWNWNRLRWNAYRTCPVEAWHQVVKPTTTFTRAT